VFHGERGNLTSGTSNSMEGILVELCALLGGFVRRSKLPHLTQIGMSRSLPTARLCEIPGPGLSRFRIFLGTGFLLHNLNNGQPNGLKTRRFRPPPRCPTFPPMPSLPPHEFILPSDRDSRSPCPALNALANHGILFVHLHTSGL
jgi:hypothetical protein